MERTGWRDEDYSRWHRTLGPNLPMTDIDSVEYHYSVPVACIETKHMQAQEEHIYTASLRCLENLAEAADLPCFITRYDLDDMPLFHVEPRNPLAEQYVPEPRYMDEGEYTRFLYALRREPHATH